MIVPPSGKILFHTTTMMRYWIPRPITLSPGSPNPLPYPDIAGSDGSSTDVFETGMNKRDNPVLGCVVCGVDYAVEHTHIVPTAEINTVRILPHNIKLVSILTPN